MATSTLIQFLESGEGAKTSHRRQTESFLITLANGGGAPATISIAPGTWVSFDATKAAADKMLYVRPSGTTPAAGSTHVVGVVAEGADALIDAGGTLDVRIEVVISGYVQEAAVTTGVAAGAALVVDTTAGRADAAAAGEIPCGVALTLAAGNVAEVLVIKNF